MPNLAIDEFEWDAFIGDTMDASAATVGAWFRCLYRMRRAATRGQITRSMTGFGRLFGTSPEQAKAIVSEIKGLEIGEVDEQPNGEVTLTNRRMYRKYLADKSNAERQARYKENHKPEVDNASVTNGTPTPHINLKEEEDLKKKERRNTCGPEILRIFTFWQTRLNHPKALLTSDRKSVIAARLKDGYSVEDLEKAIEGCRRSSYHMGNNEQGKVFDSLDLIFRNGSKVEQFIGYCEGKTNGTNQQRGNRPTAEQVKEESADFIAQKFGLDRRGERGAVEAD